ncbi:hypothetical protein, partial [Pseudomonas sp. IT-P218]|uniref:hypothetical protein n=1 Tax=Pseudomonas sp. IT-P218 TaxID=3026449 RepID=UPI0039E098D5
LAVISILCRSRLAGDGVGEVGAWLEGRSLASQLLQVRWWFSIICRSRLAGDGVGEIGAGF